MLYMCATCKVKRKSLQAPTIPSIGRRNGQSSNVNSRRGSASQSTTPSLNDIHTTGRVLGSGISSTTVNSKNSTNICTIPSHADLQHQIDKIVNTLDELKILCATNNTTINLLKQENLRLTELVSRIQTAQPATVSTDSSTITASSPFLRTKSATRQPADNNIMEHSIQTAQPVTVSTEFSTITARSPFPRTCSATRQPDNNSIIKHSINLNNLSHDNNNNNSSNVNLNLNSHNCNSSNFSNFNKLNINSHTFNRASCSRGIADCQNTINPDSDGKVSIPSTAKAPLTIFNINDTDLIERRELFIPGFMHIHSESNLRCIAFSILVALIPSLNQSDICDVRFAHPKRLRLDTQYSTPEHPSFIITLKTSNLVQMVMHAKKAHNYFSTKDISLSSLNSEVAIALPDTKIFINEVLSTSDRTRYISVKETAKRLGFKYVWYSNGDFLVRWRDRMRSHKVRTISDLDTILRSLNTPSHCYNNIPTKIYVASHHQHDLPIEPNISN